MKLLDKYKLHTHQIHAIKDFFKIIKNKNEHDIKGMIVSHQMGLGKTLTSLYIVMLMANKFKNSINLYVCPKTIIDEVVRDTKKFFGNKFKILIAHRDYMNTNELTYKLISSYNLVITTYEGITSSYTCNEYHNYQRIYNENDKYFTCAPYIPCVSNYDNSFGRSIFHDLAWNLIISDESQKMGNIKTKRSVAMLSLLGKYKLCLTGTSIRNEPGELLTQFKFIGLKKNIKVKDWLKYFIDNKLTKFMSIRDFDNTNI